MKYVITGSTGHISKPIIENLVKAGHEVIVISSDIKKEDDIKALGASPAIGSVEEADFLAAVFRGADAVYLMIPPKWTVSDWIGYQKAVADNFVDALNINAVKHVVVLSSIGAHMGVGAGPVDGLGYLEQEITSKTRADALFLRPSYFYYNLFNQIGMIKHAGIMGSQQPASHKLVLTHTTDIAEVATEALLKLDFKGKTVQYIASDERTWAEITKVLGSAIGKPELPYVEFSYEQSHGGMLGAGLSKVLADGYATMGEALRSGEMEADYWKNKPAKLGKIKLEDFAKEFAGAFSA